MCNNIQPTTAGLPVSSFGTFSIFHLLLAGLRRRAPQAMSYGAAGCSAAGYSTYPHMPRVSSPARLPLPSRQSACHLLSLQVLSGPRAVVTEQCIEMAPTGSEVVLVTGGSGFLGQHVVMQLQSDPAVREVRVVDLKPYVNRLGFTTRVPVQDLRADLAEPSQECVDFFQDVDVVIHCAGLVDRSYPADTEALHRNNVQATQEVVSLCVRCGVPRLVVTSSMEVVLVPYVRGGSFSLFINQTEKRALPPPPPHSALTAYGASKLSAESVALAANGTRLDNGGVLRTVALRPPLMYGEEDRALVPGLLRLARLCDNTLYQLGGPGNRQQHAYVGNVAWAHLCAARALLLDSELPVAQEVSGLPVFVTDDTPKGDVLRLAQLLLTFPDVSGVGAQPLVRVRSTPLPSWLWYLAAAVVELPLRVLGGRARLPLQPSAYVRYLSSVVLLSRMRAETRLLYAPKYRPEDAIARSRAFYARAKDLAELMD